MRPLRNSDPSLFRIISIRTCGAAIWMVPSGKMKRLLGGIVARYQEIFGVEIYAYCFLGNHFHMLVRALRENLDEFYENVNREIARRVNWRWKREGRFWSRRYDDIQVARMEDLLDAFLYVTTNPTRHGLIENSRHYPGLNSFEQALDGKDREYTFYHYSAETEEARTTTHKLKLSVLPEFEHLTPTARRNEILRLLNERMEMYREQRKAERRGFLTVKKLLTQEPGSVPKQVSRSKRPHCITSCIQTWKKLKREMRERLAHYIEASFEYRRGILNFPFPPFSYKPPTHRAPRLFPFKPLPRISILFPA